MNLFLSGGGSSEDSIELDKKFVQTLNPAKPVLYIPIAINTDKHPYLECLEWVRSNFRSLGFDNFVMWNEENLKEKTEKDFEQFSGIYIGGGNTFKLLKELKEFGTFEILRRLAQKDIPIYGGSAGAIILARTIIPAMSADENEVGLTEFSALDLVQGYDVWCHYFESEEQKVKEYMSTYRIEKVIAISENAGLFVTESSVEVVGYSSAKVFEGESVRVVESGQRI